MLQSIEMNKLLLYKRANVNFSNNSGQKKPDVKQYKMDSSLYTKKKEQAKSNTL